MLVRQPLDNHLWRPISLRNSNRTKTLADFDGLNNKVVELVSWFLVVVVVLVVVRLHLVLSLVLFGT